MIGKLIRAVVGNSERTNWESVLTQLGSESTSWSELDGVRTGGYDASKLSPAPPPNAPDVNLALLGLTGQEMYVRAKALSRELRGLAERGATVQQWQLLIREVGALAEMGQTLNSLAEVKLHQVKPKVETIALLPLMGSILAKRANDLRRSGILLVPELQSCDIEADAGLSRALIETAIEWSLPFGNQLTVKTEISPWAEAAKVVIIADHVVRTQDAVPPIDRTSIFLWELINELALAAGVLVTRSQIDGKTTLSIDFPVHNDNDGQIATEEMRLQMMDGPQLSKLNVVVYAHNQAIRLALDKALLRVDCRPRYASSLPQLVRECELSFPAAIVFESEMLDSNVESLIADLRRHVRNFAAIEIVQTPNVFDIALPGSGNPCRLSATSIDANLADALRFELAQS